MDDQVLRNKNTTKTKLNLKMSPFWVLWLVLCFVLVTLPVVQTFNDVMATVVVRLGWYS